MEPGARARRRTGRATVQPIAPGVVRALARPAAYPADAGRSKRVQWIQTHLSHVFLTRDRVYKLRKAVDLGFLDFRTRAERNADCLREVRLNRRLAPDVYLGVAPIVRAPGGHRVGALGETIDHADREHVVVMRRLPDGRDALSLLGRGELRARHLDAIAARLARFHAEHRLAPPSAADARRWPDAVAAPIRETLADIPAGVVNPARVAAIRARIDTFLDHARPILVRRRRRWRAVDGHGDVHLQHVWFETAEAEPLFVDCVEFSDALRRIDAAAEVAFLAMDLRYRRRPALADRFVRTYAAAADDSEAYLVLDGFVAYRAAVRAKVAALAAADPGIAAPQRRAAARSARDHLALAERALAPRRAAALVLIAGVVGTGKSTAAAALADATGGVVVASDRVRKALAGRAPTDRGGAAAGLYTDESKDRVYAALLERAAPIVASGRVAVLDASYARAAHRAAALDWAVRRGLPVWIVEVRCAAKTALARLRRREARGTDPSDAGPAFYAESVARFEPFEASAAVHRVLRTDAPAWRPALRRIAREIRARARRASARA